MCPYGDGVYCRRKKYKENESNMTNDKGNTKFLLYVRHRTKGDVLHGPEEEADASCSIHCAAGAAWELGNSSNDCPVVAAVLPGKKTKRSNREAPSYVPWEASWTFWAVVAAACDRAWVDHGDEEEAVDYGGGDVDDDKEAAAVVHTKEEVRGDRDSTEPGTERWRPDPNESNQPTAWT